MPRRPSGANTLALIERVVILGSGGAGKSRLAWRLAARTGLPVVHLDRLFWRAGWVPAPEEEARRGLAGAVERDRWILEGNFLPEDHAEADPRFRRADTVVFLDVPRVRCAWRVLSRLVRDRKRSRPDLPEACSEGFDLELLRWIWRYPAVDRPRVFELLERLDSERVTRYHLRSDADIRRFLETVRARATA
jgi:adenylate kinase family enzyme